MESDATTGTGPTPGVPTVLHVVGGKSAQGGIMAFVELAAGLPVEGVSQWIWKHREFAGSGPGGRAVCEGVATATDLGMGHDLWAGMREAVALRRWLRGRRGVILHAHSRVGILASCLAGRGRPVAVHLHKLSGQPWIYRALVAMSGARWVFNSRRTRVHHGVAAEAATVIYPPIRWPAGPAGGDPTPVRLVAAGAYVRVKQFDRLLAALAILRREGVSVPLEIYGRSTPPVDAGCDGELAARAAEVGGVTLRAYDRAWADGLRAGDVFVHAADLEAYGIVILEAYGRGCRVVVPPASVLEELLPGGGAAGGEGAGVFVAASTEPSELAGALRAALADRGEAGNRWGVRRGVAGRVSVEECVCQLRALYRSLAATQSTDGTATT